MNLYRFAKNPYKPSTWKNGANDLDTSKPSGIFCFDPTRKAIRCWEDYDTIEEEVNPQFLIDQFGETAFGGQLHTIDIDESEIISRGYGRYANLCSDNWDDYIYIPECYVVFGEY